MTTAVENVSSAVRGYVAAVSGGGSTVPEIFGLLGQYVVGGLEPGEAVLRVECLRSTRPDGTTAAGLAVLTDRAVLLAEEGVPGQRIPLLDITDVRGANVEGDGGRPTLDLFFVGGHQRIVAASVDGWNPELARAEIQAFVAMLMAQTERVRAAHRPVAEPQPVPAAPVHEYPEPAAGVPQPSGATSAAQYGQARFVGDAAPIGGIPLSRLFNAICYAIAGIALLVISAQPDLPGGGSMALAVAIGLGAIAYGAKILLTRTSYWVSSWVYLLAFGAVAAMFGVLAN